MVKRKQSVLEDLIDLTALLPWWAGLLLALLYLVKFRDVLQPGKEV